MEYNLTIEPREINIMPESELEEILQNVRMILLTQKFSVPLDRAFGISANIVDAPINFRSQIAAEIASAISTFEPRAALKNIDFTADLNGTLHPVLSLELSD